MKFQKTIAATLSAAMLLSVSSFAATPSDFSDFPADWSTDALTHAVENGLLNGSDGKINAKGTLTRAQMAAIVNRAFGAEKAADLTRFVDMLQSAWYYNDMGKAVQMGTFVGSGDKLNPEAPITREQAFAVLARAFALPDGNASSLSKFSDSASVSSWAVGSAAALVEAGYVNGSDGKLNPKGYMTRAEFAQMMDNLVKAYVTTAETVTQVPAGNVIVRAGGATLKNITVDGDLVIADGATSVTLDGVTVKGNIILRGGANGVTITGSTSANGVTVENPNGTTVVSGDGSKLGTVHVKTDLTVNGTLSNASVDEKATLTVNQGGKVGSVTVNAPGSQVKGSGTVNTVQANASNTTVTTPNTKVTAGTGTSNVKAGDKTVEPGKTETVGSNTSGGGGGSSSRNTTVAMTKLEVAGNTYYYGKAASSGTTTFTVDGKTVSAEALAGTDVYFFADADNTEKTVYGTANVPYADFYYAELGNEVTASNTLDITSDAASAQRADGMYDAVSCATASKSVKYGASYNDINAESTDAIKGHIYGVKTPVKLSADLYAKAYALGQCDKTGNNSLIEMVKSIGDTLTETATAQYKEIYANGMLSAWQSDATAIAIDASTVTAALSSSTAWGSYQVDFTNFPSEINSQTNVLGVVLETSDGAKYALKHAENLWLQSQEFAFAAEAMTEPHGNQLGYQRFADIPGKTITKVTYLLNGYKNVTINTSLYCPKLLTAEQKEVTAEVLKDFSNNGNAQVKLDLSKLPSDYQVKLDSVTKGARHGTALSTDDYSYDATTGVLTINHNDDNTYAIVISDAAENGYGSVKVSVELNSYTYAYAAVPYDEYWKSEDVYLSGTDWTASSDESDYDYNYSGVMLKERDKGAYDATSRATARHGIHRGSYQQVMTFHTQEGRDFEVAYWVSGTELVLKSGEHVTFASTKPTTDSEPVAVITMANGTEYHMTGSVMTGIKYVPVKVKTSDFADFAEAYEVTQNGEELTGGYTERSLVGFTGIYAAVDADTNGLKEVTKNSNGSFSFAKRITGTGSGIQNTTLKTVDESNITITPQPFSGGTYGAMFRIHLTGSAYGDLGSRMQSVTWQYYGDGDTVLATYGTKFAADIWMHGSNGIQLGLTDSLRAKLPEGTNGTGKWVGTIHALGYKDFTFTVNLEEENIRDTGADPITTEQKTQLQALVNEAAPLVENYNADTASDALKLLKEHYDEAVALLTNENATTGQAEELLGELPSMIAAVKAEQPTTITKTATLAMITDQTTAGSGQMYYGGNYNVTVTVTLEDGKIKNVLATSTATSSDVTFFNMLTSENFYSKFVGKDANAFTNVDAVSNATYSSATVNRAVRNALNAD